MDSAAIERVLTTLLSVVGGGGVLLFAAAWLIRQVINQRLGRSLAEHKSKLDADLERHKQALRLESESALERVRSRLRRQESRLKELGTRADQVFLRMHEKRMTIVEEFYSELLESLRLASECVSVFQGPDAPDAQKVSDFQQEFRAC